MKPLCIALALILSGSLFSPAEAGPLRDLLTARHADKPSSSSPSRTDKTTQQSALRDVAYGPHSRHKLDVYSPDHPQGARLILMVHGGGWRTGDKRMGRVVDNKALHWVQEGNVFVSINYRLLPESPPDQQLEDVARALAYVQTHASAWGADPARVVLMGHSAGAHLVALLAASPTLQAQYGATPPQAAVSLDSGALDLVGIMSGKHFGLFDDAFGKDPAYWERLSPLHQLKQKTAPFLIVCSSRREGVCDESRRFAERARQLGGRAEVLPQDLSHGDINSRLGEAGTYTDTVDAFLHSLP